MVKRQLIAAGSSAGVAAAFGAPIGGSLFSYEISKPNTFWTFSMLWRVFFAASISTFMLAILESLVNGAPFSLSASATLKFGKLEANEDNGVLDIPAMIFIGAICGLLGAFFIFVNIKMSIWRKKYITQNYMKLLEASFFVLATTLVFFGACLLRKDSCHINSVEYAKEEVQFMCRDGFYNPLASLILNTEGGTIRNLMAYPVQLKSENA